MSLNRILIAGLAATTLSTGALANDNYYRCNDRLCYDDQAEETRRLNEMQLDNPGAGEDAAPQDDYRGQGGPSYDGPPDPDDYNNNDNQAYGPNDNDQSYGPNDDDQSYGPAPDDDRSYDDQSSDDDSGYSDDDDQ